MTTTTATTTQVYQVFIKATPEQIWEAITKPEFTCRYFHGARIENTATRHHSLGPDGSVWGDGPVFEFDPPRRLSHEWRSLYDPELVGEEPSRVTWEIEPQDGGLSRLTVVHDRLERSPGTAERVSGSGWMFVLSSLKTLLETGQPLSPRSTGEGLDAD
ncbi:MAG: SRPBCC family protein [Gaiellaceae bacterium]